MTHAPDLPPSIPAPLERILQSVRESTSNGPLYTGRLLLLNPGEASTTLEAALQRVGHVVTRARDSLHALELILLTRECPFDLILLEPASPGFSGYDICRAIRQKWRRNDLSVIFLVPADDRDPLQCLRCGGDDVLALPWREEEVMLRISMHLDLLFSHRALAQHHSQLQAQQNHLIEQERLATLGLLSAGVAHEINNPNYFIKTGIDAAEIKLAQFCQFLNELLEGDDSDEMKEAFDQRASDIRKQLNIIRDGSIRISEIVESMRDIAKGDDGEKRLIDPLDALESTVNLVKMSYRHDIDFEFQVESRALIEGRDPQLKQVFMNLIINACQAIEEKRHQGMATRGRIVLHSRMEDGALLISIEDNGTGMSEATKQKLFSTSFTTKAPAGGTGLGLPICMTLLNEHNATLYVVSSEGVGTTMILRFEAGTA